MLRVWVYFTEIMPEKSTFKLHPKSSLAALYTIAVGQICIES